MNETAKRYFGWVFEAGADFYAWMTSQGPWEANCADMAARLPADARKIVDLGCGPGVSAFELARRIPGARVIGLDIAARMLEQARRRQRRSGVADRLGWIRGDAHHLPFHDGTVDAMTGHSFLYLVPQPDRALEEVRRCLRPGGKLVLMEPQHGGGSVRDVLKMSKDPRFLLSMSLWRPVSRMHGQFTRDTLGQTLERAGFRDALIEPTLGGLGLLVTASRGN
jgi:ubiquinone/menaquinone biosynthesis C-methylase UbiE